MKTLFTTLLLLCLKTIYSQAYYQKYQVQTATQPQFNPSPLLKKYDQQNNQPVVAPDVRYETYTTPALQETRVFGYYNTDNNSTQTKTMNLLITNSINHLGQEEVKVTSYKNLGEQYWVKLTIPLTASNISNSQEYSHHVNIGGLDIYFKF